MLQQREQLAREDLVLSLEIFENLKIRVSKGELTIIASLQEGTDTEKLKTCHKPNVLHSTGN